MKKIILVVLPLLCFGITNQVKAVDQEVNLYCEYGNKEITVNINRLGNDDNNGAFDIYKYGTFETLRGGTTLCDSTTNDCLKLAGFLKSDGNLECPKYATLDKDGKVIAFSSKQSTSSKELKEQDCSGRCNLNEQGKTDTTPNPPATVVGGCDLGGIPQALPIFISNLINLLKILVPILLIIMGMIDFFLALVASDEKKMKESQSKFIRRTIGAVLVFLVVAIVQFVFGLVKTSDTPSILGCIDLFVNGSEKVDNPAKRTCSWGKYQSKNLCPTNDDFGNLCVWKDDTCVTGSKAKYCSDYSANECPDHDNYGYKCGKTTEGGRPVCSSTEKGKYCAEYTYENCPGQDDYGYYCETSNVGGRPACVSLSRDNISE